MERKFLGEDHVMEILNQIYFSCCLAVSSQEQTEPAALLCGLLPVKVGFPKLRLSTRFPASWCASLWKSLLGTKLQKNPADHQN